MNQLLELHKKYLKTLLECRVDFLITGGYALIYHGYVRTTGDMDIWLRPDNNNKIKILEALARQGVQNNSIQSVSQLDFSTPVAFHIGQIPEKIDFFTFITGLVFDTARQNSAILSIENLKVPFLSFSDLILNKMMTSRNRDKVDVEELQKVARLGKNKK